jgi:hypothetical protein
MYNQNISAWRSRRHLREVALTAAHDPTLRETDEGVVISAVPTTTGGGPARRLVEL